MLIKNYISQNPVNPSDKVIGTDGITNETKNFLVSDLQGICCDTKQKFISANYLLTSDDDGYTIIITNGATPISITVPTGLSAKLQVGFIQDGTADVTFTPTGTTLRNAISGYKIKGQYDQAYLEQGATSSIYYLLGNTKV
jgi:hypothetical protein